MRALQWKGALISVLAAVYLFRLGTFSGHMAAHLLLTLAAPPLLLAATGWQLRVPGWLAFVALNLTTAVAHLPAVNRAAMMEAGSTLGEGLAFLGSGLLFWCAARRGGPAHAWGAVGLLTAQMAACALLGAAITFSRGVYPGRPDDVSLGGVLMWVGGGAVYMVWGMLRVSWALRPPQTAGLNGRAS